MSDIESQRTLGRLSRRRWFASVVMIASVLPLAGCTDSPTFNLLGSYFPAWMICAVVGGLLTYLSHVVLIRMKIAHELWPLQLTHTLLFVFWTCALWITFFNS